MQASWQDVLDDVARCHRRSTSAARCPERRKLFWQLAAAELHLIMQLVTADVTFVVSGAIGVSVCARRL